MRSSGRPARRNIWRLIILMWLTSPSTRPELQGMVTLLVTASRSCFSPLANDEMPGSPASLASAIHCGDALLDGLGEVLPQMEPVGDLDLRCPGPGAVRERARPVTPSDRLITFSQLSIGLAA